MNWGQLKTAVASFANRSDLTAMMPTFLALAECSIYDGVPEANVDQLRISQMVQVVPNFTGDLPADCIQIRRVTAVNGSSRQALEFRTLGEITSLQGSFGQPLYYSLQGSNTLVYGPSFGASVELVYWKRFTTPVLDADTNWLLTNAHSVVQYAMLLEVGLYLRDAALTNSASKLFATAQKALQDKDVEHQHSGSTLRIVSDSVRAW